MKNSINSRSTNIHHIGLFNTDFRTSATNHLTSKTAEILPEILFITTFPPRECGIATYSQDLIKSINNKFKNTFNIKICALETDTEKHQYDESVKYILNTDQPNSFSNLSEKINANNSIQMVLVQHEFGLFRNNEAHLIEFLHKITKPVTIVFHTVLPNANEAHKENVQIIGQLAHSIIVMTHSAALILKKDYGVDPEKISVIPHGTHLVPHSDKDFLKEKYNLSGRKVLSTFGLLSSGKSIETTLDAMPSIIEKNKDVLFLIIGKTHPSVVKQEGEKYRAMLDEKIQSLKLQNHVLFVNAFLPLHQLLDFLQLTDIYLFTSKDPNQAVSGTFSYAMSCGCPIISTPIPHANEVLSEGAGIIIDFGNSVQLAKEVNRLLLDNKLRKNISANGLHKIVPTAWENSAIAHAFLFEKMGGENIKLEYKIPEINLDHIKKLTTDYGMIQFSIINQPDLESGYTIDDNARAMVAMCKHFELTKDKADLEYVKIYLNFITSCLQDDGSFLNYVDEDGDFTDQNYETNLEDSNGRAIWALGYLISLESILPVALVQKAKKTLERASANVLKMHSTRAMAFVIKGLYYVNSKEKSLKNTVIIKELADRMIQMYKHESKPNWNWFESYLTYGNSILPEAMLCAYLSTGDTNYKAVAKTSFDFLLSKIFNDKSIKVISNKGWMMEDNSTKIRAIGGEQPIDIAYTILALNKFSKAFNDPEYTQKMKIAFSWFLGNNHLHQIIYNPCTGGCYDGLEDTYINLNQGAESTVSYLMARLCIEKNAKRSLKLNPQNGFQKEVYAKLNHKKTLA
ncbi:glycosyltransferase [Flavobacterium granuli]|uniref:Glycosyltransferase involved in cell wall biosynthesis n=1 Tax=Flavobacterium granuli TaxID=280093 RepID=A0ABU1S019_9FLAO|nr:glycosyltransferase [Flavobacterium granuli]MDR6844382.1 glycosyltransferase involved in cell wall biosynthesis [Flavobacterium granuli]